MIGNDPLQDRKNHESMQGLIESLQQKIKTYKKQIEEAEEIAALNLAKFRQVGPTESFSIFFFTQKIAYFPPGPSNTGSKHREGWFERTSFGQKSRTSSQHVCWTNVKRP